MNPLLEKFNTPFSTPPFSKIKNEHFKPAFEKAIALAKKEIDEIVVNPAAPTFENTLVALDFSGELLETISHIFFNLNSAETSEEIQKIAKEVSPLLSEFSNDVGLNQELFAKIKIIYDTKSTLKLTPEQEMLLDKTYKSFVRNGANLNDADKTKLREIDKKLSELSLNFGENVLAEINNYELLLTNEKELSGLPEGVVEAAKISAEQKN
ncbi:MAG: M3 family metallopeptidase, partial [Flavobacteriales bacterium]|nr:M3 family metallopeptidase [Flavobacteriales bacterium]